MEMDQIQVDMESFINNGQSAKELTVNTLLNLGHITPEIASDFLDNYQIILVKPSWYKRWVDNVFKKEKEGWVMKIVKF